MKEIYDKYFALLDKHLEEHERIGGFAFNNW